ncbi:MAG: DsbA family protein [Caulobacteraceae bacterium]|nr:DsbA family protein [Caulobacteraceae bacterium]
MDGVHLIYFADPMCSWCWGFAPTIAAVRERYGDILPIRVIMGGLRPGTEEPMTEAAKQSMRPHWGHVTEASGQPFDYGFFDREDFVYDTDPAARAVVVVRRARPELALDFLERTQRAFYAENRDVTDPQVLGDLAAEFSLDRDAFLADHASETSKEETWRDYATSQRAGVTGFPTLIGGPGAEGAYGIVAQGFQPPGAVLGIIDRWLARASAPADA